MIEQWLDKFPCSSLNRPMPRLTRQRQQVAILGAAELDRRERPPLHDDAWDVWGCNSLWARAIDDAGLLRADAWFELHPLSAQTEQELLNMLTCPVPLYVLDDVQVQFLEQAKQDVHYPARWEAFPFSVIQEKFPWQNYYTCTFAYQIALALYLGYETIGLWGMELWQGSVRERRIELPCVTYWIGIARGMGVRMVTPTYSRLATYPYRYGYDYDADVQRSASDDRELGVRCATEMMQRHRQITDVQRKAPA